MVCGKIEKTTGLLIVVFILLSSLIYVPDWSVVGVSTGCDILQRLGYSFFHASFLHAAVNAWCFISILFIYDILWWRLIAAYLIAVAAPDFVLSSTPTVGLSAVCFALLGSIAFQVKRKLYYNGCMALYIAVGFLFPLVNGWLHLYSYVAGLIVGFINMPIPCRKK
ncbi:rhomboid family intramembrane serine protease [Muribaculum intestinale]|jgi:membrane associated rhomboid family serine protease|uniref:rhomboid family intramembrane serine protease n=1 Tax=Muribaculum intestinale TaxID=1796646 RepID=UPI0025B4ED55|nr:rhomboid family intramembrane serine protease [Muribaculum intestinale]